MRQTNFVKVVFPEVSFGLSIGKVTCLYGNQSAHLHLTPDHTNSVVTILQAGRVLLVKSVNLLMARKSYLSGTR